MKSEMDNREWLNDYVSLKQVNPETPFSVPDDYFNSLEERIKVTVFLDGLNKETGLVAPHNYFDELQSNLQSRINIEAALHQSTGDFTVPDNYFDALGEQIEARVAIEEALGGKTEGFSVPDQYFDKLQNAILNKTANPPHTDNLRRGIVHRLITSGTFKYATAACLLLAAGTTLFMNKYESAEAVHKRSYIHKALSNVSDADIIDYLQLHMDAADTRGVMDEADKLNAGNDVSDEELREYLSTH